LKLTEMSVNTINIYIVLHNDTAETTCLRDDVKHITEGGERK